MSILVSGEVVPAQLSQESHLLSPETSAAGSDNGQLEDLKGESFSDLVEATRRPIPKGEAAPGAATATPSHTQQTPLIKAPASLASRTNPPQTSREPGKSNNAKMSAKSALSASRRAAPVNVQIVRLASSSSSTSSHAPGPAFSQPSTSSTAHKATGPASRYEPAHSFTMSMLPMTKIRELCLHAAGHARRHFGAVLDGSRFEARDRDGHVFAGHETISDEVLSGETIYLVEGGLDARGAAMAVRGGKAGDQKRKGSGARERGRLLCLQSLELEGEGEGEEKETKTPYRTPSVSSRASSSRGDSRGEAAQPRLTPSQKALAIAQMVRTPISQERVAERKPPTSSAVRRTLPSPALLKVGEVPDGGVCDKETHVGKPAQSDVLEADLVAPSSLRSSCRPPQPPPRPQTQQHAIPPNPQESQLVIPDSQDPFSQEAFSQEPVESDQHAPTISMPDASDTSKTHARPFQRVNTTTTQPKLQTSRPDPYDITTVLLDEEDRLSDGINTNTTTSTKMASSVRKLGSATARRPSVAPPPVSLPSPHRHRPKGTSPVRTNEAAAPAVGGRQTPTQKATPNKANPSSPAVPLPSSPTTHVAAAIAKGAQHAAGKTRRPQLPSPGQLVFRVPSDSDSDDDLIEEEFRDLSCSVPRSSLPWSAPPLRAVPDAETGLDNQAARSCSLAGSTAGEVNNGGSMVDEVFIVGVSPRKSPLKKPLGRSPGRKSSQTSPAKASIITSSSKSEEPTIIHDSSSAGESEEEKEVQIVKKEPPSTEESPSGKTKLPDIPIIDEKPQNAEKPQHEVIELSSGSDSDIEPPTDMLEDDEAELLGADIELLTGEEKLPSHPRSPAQATQPTTPNSPKKISVKLEPAYEEPPPSAQASKRKRLASDEPDPEDEQGRRKRVKREAKKARRKRSRGEKTGMLLEEEREKQLAALQEERKKLALEKARRRALELEVIVSSPIKREPSVELSEEGDDDDSGLGSSAYGEDASVDTDRAGVALDGDDKNDSLSSKETEDHHPSWRKLSKLHLSLSPTKGSEDGPGKDGPDQQVVPPTSTPAIIEAQLQQCVEERFHRMPFDDWGFLENTLGKGSSGGYGYSPLEVHNRVHLDMVHRAQHPPPLHASGDRESGDAGTKDQAKPSSSGLPGQAGDDDAPARSRSTAPSPKEHGVREKERAKTRERLRKERHRKRERGRKAKGRYHHDFRGSRVADDRKKQKHRQKGH